jgi:hypothetical protein
MIADRKKILPMLPAALGIFLVQLPWLPTLLKQTGSVKDSYWIGQINTRTHLEFFLRVTGGDVDSPFQKPLAWTIGMLVLVGLLIRILRKRMDKEYIFMLSWLIVPTLIPTIVSFVFAPVFFYRYLIFTAIPLLILTVDALKNLFIKSRVPLIALTIVIAFMSFRVDWQIFTNYPRSMREAVSDLYQTKVRGNGPVYTVLPAFAEVLHYIGNQDHIIVSPEGLIQFSGKSLLDAYVAKGVVTIAEPPTSAPYWFLTPDKTVEYHK